MSPMTAEVAWLWGANLFTLAGAVCFFVASYLMIPELFGVDRVIDTTFIRSLNSATKQS
jgi:hypothetical protein